MSYDYSRIARVVNRSSFGTNAVRQLQGRTPNSVLDAVRKRLRDQARELPAQMPYISRNASQAVMPRQKGVVMPKGNRRHVVPSPKGGWDVKKPGSSRASAHARTQSQAEKIAKQILKKQGGGEATTHGRDGRIRDSDTVPPAKDPHPPKDTKH